MRAIRTPSTRRSRSFHLTITAPVRYKEPQNVSVYCQHIDGDALLEYDCEADLWLQALDAANP